MAITRRQLNKTTTYVLNENSAGYYRGLKVGTQFMLDSDDGSHMPRFRMVVPVTGVDTQWWIELNHLDKYVAPTTVAVPIKLAQDFINCHDEDGTERVGGSKRQCAALRAALVKVMPEKPEVLAAKALLEAAGYKVEKAS